MSYRYCDCRDCKRAKRKGLIFGQRRNSPYDEYVRWFRFQKGRRPEARDRY